MRASNVVTRSASAFALLAFALGFAATAAMAAPLVASRDGRLWLIARSGEIETYDPKHGAHTVETGTKITDLAASPDGSIWFTSRDANIVGHVDPDGTIRTTDVGHGPWGRREPDQLVVGAHGAAFFTEHNALAIGLVYPGGAHQEFLNASVATRTFISEPGAIAFRPEPVSALSPVPLGGVWFAAGNRYGSILLQQTMHIYSAATQVQSVLALQDGAWLASSNVLMHVDSSGAGIEAFGESPMPGGGVLVADAHDAPCYLLSTTARCVVDEKMQVAQAQGSFARDRDARAKMQVMTAANGLVWWISPDTHAVCHLDEADSPQCTPIDAEPAGIACTPDGFVWVLDAGADRLIQVAQSPARVISVIDLNDVR